ncbi:hypothetical protein LZ554_006779 [Drepanopeziza brunnea f. sp. 'monogermtubi']|nr:hypothetical protein LZ554_006779 [Drepanopeziza brunnea f. sp. 'monogermtubi']
MTPAPKELSVPMAGPHGGDHWLHPVTPSSSTRHRPGNEGHRPQATGHSSYRNVPSWPWPWSSPARLRSGKRSAPV